MTGLATRNRRRESRSTLETPAPFRASVPYQSQHGGTQWNLLMAASALTVLPVIVVFFLTQRTFLQGLTFLKNVEAT